jgi:hypothetical protein
MRKHSIETKRMKEKENILIFIICEPGAAEKGFL